MDNCFLSFIVPVYNAAEYLPECLDSLLNQNISKDCYEIICVNDGSRDSSLQVLQSYAQRFPNIVIIDKENGGVTTARNAGLKAARGDYLWFVDADDFIKENILQDYQTKIRETGCDRLVIGCYIFDDVLTDAEREQSQKGELPLNGPGCDSIVVRSLFRRGFLLEHDLYFSHPELTHGEDGMFMYEACAFQPVSVEVDEAVYFYRIHSGSADTAVSVAGLQKKLRSFRRIVELLGGYYEGGRRDTQTANAYMTFLWFALLTVASLPPKESRSALRQLKQQGLFPCRMLPECDLEQSYMTDRQDLVGRLYNTLYMHLHTRWGFGGMYLIRQLLRLKKER